MPIQSHNAAVRAINSLDMKTQLHEQIEVIYVVDRFLAIFSTDDGNSRFAEAHGKSILEALQNLADHDKVRSYRQSEDRLK